MREYMKQAFAAVIVVQYNRLERDSLSCPGHLGLFTRVKGIDCLIDAIDQVLLEMNAAA